MSATSWPTATAVAVLDETGVERWTSDEEHRRNRAYQP